jgi:hypothetical protein
MRSAVVEMYRGADIAEGEDILVRVFQSQLSCHCGCVPSTGIILIFDDARGAALQQADDGVGYAKDGYQMSDMPTMALPGCIHESQN